MQDRDGRGPYRPGLSERWSDNRADDLPPFYDELGVPIHKVRDLFTDGWHAGCGCSSKEQLRQWFSRAERRRLKLLGFREVEFRPDRIVAVTPTQVVFEHRTPLARLWGKAR